VLSGLSSVLDLGCTSATDKSDSTQSSMDTPRVRNSIPRAVLMRSLLLSMGLATVIIRTGEKQRRVIVVSGFFI